jgi:uncharacterized protein YhaN
MRNLRRHDDLTVDLAPGLTVVRGPNEAGKTTLQRAIELALTRKVTAGGADMDSYARWDAAAADRPEIEMAFTWEDEDGTTREGRLEKRFFAAKGTVKLDLDGEVITDPARADEEVAALTGIPSEKFFAATASVRHHELDALDATETTLRDRLQASISGGDEGSGKAKAKLADALRKLRQAGAKNPGRIKTAEDAVTAADMTMQNGEAALLRLQADRDDLGVARDQRSEAEARLAEDTALLDRARQAERLIAEREAARVTFERYETAATAVKELAELRAAPNRTAGLALADYRTRVSQIAETDMKVATLSRLFDAAMQEPPAPAAMRRSRLDILGALIVLAGLVSAVVGGVGIAGFLGPATARSDTPTLLITVGVLAMIGGLALGVAGTWASARTSDANRAEIEKATRRTWDRERLRDELIPARAELARVLAASGHPDLASAQAALSESEQRADAIAALEARLGGLLAGEPPVEVVARRNALALEMAQKEAALDALGPIARDARARERHEAAAAEARKALELARDEEANARARVEQNTVDAEEVAAQAERLAMWREELGALQRRERVYALALEAITRAEVATMARATVFLQSRMAGDIEAVTGGRYKRVRVDDTSLGIEVFAPERGDWVKAQTLSQGTVDVVYLAARLGLVRLVTGDRRPPLILDDPFVTLDDVRGPRALELLRRISADFQVIYLTTSDRYDAIADKVIELAGPTAIDAGA